MLAVSDKLRARGFGVVLAVFGTSAAAAGPHGSSVLCLCSLPASSSSCWNGLVSLFSLENRLGLRCNICSWAGGWRALLMIHFAHYHHLLSVLVRLLRLCESSLSANSDNISSKEFTWAVFPPPILRTPISSAHCYLKSRLESP